MGANVSMLYGFNAGAWIWGEKKFFPINWGLGCEQAALSPAHTPTFSFPPPWGGDFQNITIYSVNLLFMIT
jgi:hypothetical protein